MRRTVSSARIGDKLVRYKIRIEDEPSPPGGHVGGWRLIQFMDALTQSPDLLNCGFSKPEKLQFYHSGLFWVAEGEATVEEP